jgi:hypothetical protein
MGRSWAAIVNRPRVPARILPGSQTTTKNLAVGLRR